MNPFLFGYVPESTAYFDLAKIYLGIIRSSL